MKLDVLSEDVKELIEDGPRSDPESIATLLRLRSQIDAYVTASVGEFDKWGAWALDGARSAAGWMAKTGNLPRAEAGRMVKRARTLDLLHEFADAWREGDIGAAHLDKVGNPARNPRTQCIFERDEEMLVGQARTLRFEDFARAVDYWEQLADPDGTEESAEERKNRRDVYLGPVGDMYLGKMTLDPISGAIVSGELDRLEAELFEEDWREARERLGFDPTVSDLARTPSQRRCDALVEMATRSRTAPPDGIRPRPLFSVLVDFPTLCGRVCELEQGIAVTPGSLVPWLDRADIERAVFEPPDRVQVSEKVRLFTGATRRGIQLRDRECTHPYCDRPALDCQVDHIQPYTDGGPTTFANGRLLCGFHNRLRNQRPPPPRR
ncbi:MAG TPA: DUF222 domain-containing protein [Acidimicrobiales bacterium]|nr:DUF222 domain-containing protein [Acidimicrobiales bacterium]